MSRRRLLENRIQCFLLQDLYAGIEHRHTAEVYQCLKLITVPGCQRIMRYAFDYCVSHGRKRLTCVTKSNIMKLTDGVFQQVIALARSSISCSSPPSLALSFYSCPLLVGFYYLIYTRTPERARVFLCPLDQRETDC
jgi:hypothetical protein